MFDKLQIPLFEMVMCLSEAMDLVSPALVNHHKLVAYISYSIAEEIGLPKTEQHNLLLAGALHDSGALSRRERLEGLQFELDKPYKHEEVGYLLLDSFEPFRDIALLVRYHHEPWKGGGRAGEITGAIPLGSRILHLADRVSVLVKQPEDILDQVPGILKHIEQHAGGMFMPELVESFRALAAKEYFWFDVVSPAITTILAKKANNLTTELDLNGLVELGNLFRRIIDFRSPFTAHHSVGVMVIAEAIAKQLSFSSKECQMMRVAGQFHDLGKLAVPDEILEKPGKLTVEERNIIKSHTYYTYRILEKVAALETINIWAALHHERLDGKGYPFRLHEAELPLGSRIMSVADVFTALSESRPYRKGLPRERVLEILNQMVQENALDANVVTLLGDNYRELDQLRLTEQTISAEEYSSFKENFA